MQRGGDAERASSEPVLAASTEEATAMPSTNAPASSRRLHVVLVPGFAGFDALGQLEYYAGVTPIFREWQETSATPAVLHYFDNLPTAGVATRAARLRRWITKRYARGEIQPQDEIALVGHSTGGLDIRQVLIELDAEAARGEARLRVDGDEKAALAVAPGKLLELIQRVVFLSVPQRGTNIADWVRDHGLLRKVAIGKLRTLVGAASLATAVNRLEEHAATFFAGASRADLFLAVRDAVGEMDTGMVKGNAEATADANEAASELRLWLAHIASDFGAIDDLCAGCAIAPTSPAHLGEQGRDQERKAWERWKIETRSYATLGACPYDFGPDEPVPPWEILRASTSPWDRLAADARERTDGVYLCGYRACAGGPFRLGEARTATAFASSERMAVEAYDNDGIVNTASMLWPDGEATQLVRGDHGDIIGHFRLGEAPEAGLRRYHTYDLLRSGSGFTEQTFRDIWREVFAFCSRATGTETEAA